ncbi:hypothetical protein ABZP36_008595 [Zizania latifolia]
MEMYSMDGTSRCCLPKRSKLQQMQMAVKKDIEGARGGRGQRRSVSGRLREQRARLYIMRRCVSMLLSSACISINDGDSTSKA